MEISKRGLTYAALTKLMRVSPKEISRKMRGKRKFNMDEISKLEEIFGKPAEYLIKREKD